MSSRPVTAIEDRNRGLQPHALVAGLLGKVDKVAQRHLAVLRNPTKKVAGRDLKRPIGRLMLNLDRLKQVRAGCHAQPNRYRRLEERADDRTGTIQTGEGDDHKQPPKTSAIAEAGDGGDLRRRASGLCEQGHGGAAQVVEVQVRNASVLRCGFPLRLEVARLP